MIRDAKFLGEIIVQRKIVLSRDADFLLVIATNVCKYMY